jgi:transposase
MNSNITIGMDLGDKYHIAVVFDSEGREVDVAKVNNTKAATSKYFQSYKGSTVAIEAGTHSPWISRLLKQMDCQVYVGNPRARGGSNLEL